MGLFKIFLDFYDILKQDWITLKFLEPLHTLATRAARSAASCSNPEVRIRKKMQPKFETAVRTPMKRASKRAPT